MLWSIKAGSVLVFIQLNILRDQVFLSAQRRHNSCEYREINYRRLSDNWYTLYITHSL